MDSIAQLPVTRPVWFKTRPCGKRWPHPFASCPYYHEAYRVEDRHILWPELEHSLPWSAELYGKQQQYYGRLRSQRHAEQEAALVLERQIKYREFEARGELKAIGCRVTVGHDWPSCRFGHSRLNPKTGLIENDFDLEAVERRKARIAGEKAAKRQARLEARVMATPRNFPALGETHK
jgi:hypothetical protein